MASPKLLQFQQNVQNKPNAVQSTVQSINNGLPQIPGPSAPVSPLIGSSMAPQSVNKPQNVELAPGVQQQLHKPELDPMIANTSLAPALMQGQEQLQGKEEQQQGDGAGAATAPPPAQGDQQNSLDMYQQYFNDLLAEDSANFGQYMGMAARGANSAANRMGFSVGGGGGAQLMGGAMGKAALDFGDRQRQTKLAMLDRTMGRVFELEDQATEREDRAAEMDAENAGEIAEFAATPEYNQKVDNAVQSASKFVSGVNSPAAQQAMKKYMQENLPSWNETNMNGADWAAMNDYFKKMTEYLKKNGYPGVQFTQVYMPSFGSSNWNLPK